MTTEKPIAARIPVPESWPGEMAGAAKAHMARHENCCQSILAPFLEELGAADPMLMRLSGGFFGGLTASLTCGIHCAGVMVLGLFLGRERMEDGLDGLLPIMMPAQELMGRLTGHLGSASCLELTGVDFTDLEQAVVFHGSPERKECVRRVAEGAEIIAAFLQELKARGELFRHDDPR
ncbi:MAG: C-GCAxxG-C-C family protein [Proteobacteria bacterium]|nr:C-GCAxxG-C-C family protein [Pseudomonadota bacterium]